MKPPKPLKVKLQFGPTKRAPGDLAKKPKPKKAR